MSCITTKYRLIPLLQRALDEGHPRAATRQARSGPFISPKQIDRTGHWRRIGRETRRASSSSYVPYNSL